MQTELLLRLHLTCLNIASVFVHPSDPTSVYIETGAPNAKEWQPLLVSFSGVVARRGSALFALLPLADRLACLTQGAAGLRPSLGQWVSLKVRGRYLGDVGFVIDEREGGNLHVLVPPRLLDDELHFTHAGKGKRKRQPSPPPPQQLYSASTHTYLGEPFVVDKYRVQCGRRYFEHGLQLLEVEPPLVSVATRIHYLTVHLFKASDHPLIDYSTLPTPMEWHFRADDRVYLYNADVLLEGTVRRVDETNMGADVELGERCHTFHWRDLRKRFRLGDWVDCLGGPNDGKTGLVSTIQEDFVSVLLHESEEVIHRSSGLVVYGSSFSGIRSSLQRLANGAETVDSLCKGKRIRSSPGRGK